MHIPLPMRVGNRKEIIYFTNASVNFFTNGVGTVELSFNWPNPGVTSRLSLSDSHCHVQDVIEILQCLRDPDMQVKFYPDIKHDNDPSHESATSDDSRFANKASVGMLVSELIESILNHEIENNKYLLDWKQVPNQVSMFMFTRVLTKPIVFVDGQFPWSTDELGQFTYAITHSTPIDRAVKGEFLHSFIEESCYLRWATEQGQIRVPILFVS
jgi:hypothetical protein